MERQGGSGYTVLGCTQKTKANGTRGVNGDSGNRGTDGFAAITLEPVIKTVKFASVISIINNEKDTSKMVQHPRQF